MCLLCSLLICLKISIIQYITGQREQWIDKNITTIERSSQPVINPISLSVLALGNELSARIINYHNQNQFILRGFPQVLKLEKNRKNCLAKQLHQQLHAWMGERNEGESQDKLFFLLHPNSCLYERGRKITSWIKLFGK